MMENKMETIRVYRDSIGYRQMALPEPQKYVK